MLIDGFTVFGSWPGLPYDHPVEDLISGLERFKVQRACTLSSKGIYLDANTGNETTLEACKLDARLIPIGVADPRVGGIEQVDYCKQHEFRAMALFPATQGWSLSSVGARLLMRRIAEAELPVYVEAGREGDVTAVLEATQGLPIRVILLDVSLPTLAEAISVLRLRSDARNPYIEALRAPISEALSMLRGGPDMFITTRLLCGGDTIEYVAQTIGAERLIFASRFPINCFSSAFLTAQFSSLSDADRAAIMGDNLQRLMKE